MTHETPTPGRTTGVAQEWREGWKVVMAAAIGMGTGTGLYAMLAGLFMKPLQDEFAWSRGQIAGVAAIGLVSAFLMPVLGMIIDRFGARLVATFGMIALAASYGALSAITKEISTLYLAVAFMAVVGPATTPIVFTRPVNAWFQHSRGIALGVTMTGVSVTSVLMLPILERLIDAFGWRAGYLFLAAFPLVLGLPAVLAFLVERPGVSLTMAARHESRTDNDSGLSLALALKDSRFWLLAVSMLFANIPVGGILSQLQPMLLDKGFPGPTAALLGSLFAASIALGRIGAGILLDRLWPPAVAATCLAVPIAGAALMMGPQATLWSSCLAILLFGVAQGAEADFLAFFVPRYFGLRAYGAIFGCLVMCVSVSLAAGGMFFGFVHDRFNSYDQALHWSMFALAAAAACMFASGSRMGRRSRKYANANAPCGARGSSTASTGSTRI